MEQQQPFTPPRPPDPTPHGSTYAPTNALAIVSLVLGIGSFFLALGPGFHSFIALGPLAGVPAIITGYIARNQIAQSRERGGRLALWGIILGFVNAGLFVLGLFAIVAAATLYAVFGH